MERVFGNSTTADPTWKPQPRERGTYSILSTCLITLALCVWTAVHLNIPEHRGRWKQVAFTAYSQFMEARSITKEMRTALSRRKTDMENPDSVSETDDTEEKAPEWTNVHSYFAAMGGFAFEIQDGDDNFFPMRQRGGSQPTRLAIGRNGLSFLGEYNPELIPRLTLARIEDKSKGDGLAKSLVCFQATWFCAQCFSRFSQGLPISLLERNTFGHALCALVIYSLWWEKPLDIEEPEIIPVKGEDVVNFAAAMCMCSKVEPYRLYPGCIKDSQINISVLWSPSQFDSRPVRNHGSHATHAMHRIQRFFEWAFSTIPGRHKRELLLLKIPEEPAQVRAQGLPGPALATTRITVGQSIDGVSLNYDLGSDISDHKSEALSEASLPFLDLWDFDIRRWRLAFRVVLKSTTMVDAVAECIRNFPRLGSPVKQWPLYVGRGITGLVYGGLHCLAWDAPFPTDMERLFWRISSVTVTSTGLLIALGFSWAVMPPFWTEYYGTRDRLFRSYRLILDVAGIRKRSEKERPYRAHPLAEKEIWFWQSPLDKKLTKLVFVLKIIFDIMIVLCAVFYALARLYLVVECFISLAHLPEAAYQVPRWSQYVPHIA